jgi:hypothetical protein
MGSRGRRVDSRIVGHTAHAWLTCRRQRRGQFERSLPPDACWEVLPCIGNEGIVTPEGGVGLWSEGGGIVLYPLGCVGPRTPDPTVLNTYSRCDARRPNRWWADRNLPASGSQPINKWFQNRKTCLPTASTKTGVVFSSRIHDFCGGVRADFMDHSTECPPILQHSE